MWLWLEQNRIQAPSPKMSLCVGLLLFPRIIAELGRSNERSQKIIKVLYSKPIEAFLFEQTKSDDEVRIKYLRMFKLEHVGALLRSFL